MHMRESLVQNNSGNTKSKLHDGQTVHHKTTNNMTKFVDEIISNYCVIANSVRNTGVNLNNNKQKQLENVPYKIKKYA